MITPKLTKPTPREERDAYELVTIRDLDTCQRCRRDCGPIARDHRKNRSQGGLTTPGNLQCLGMGCHDWKGANPKQALTDGWAVPGYADPLVWPARRWFRLAIGGVLELGWVIYLDRPNRSGALWERISDDDAARRMNGVTS